MKREKAKEKKKFADWKVIKWIRGKGAAVRDFFLATFENTWKGSALLCMALSSFLLEELLRSLIPVVPAFFCLVLTAILILLAGELTELLVKLLFGRKKRNRFYWFLLFLLLLFGCYAGTQGREILWCALSAFAVTFGVGLLGRSLWAILRCRRYSVLAVICLVLSLAECIAVSVFLHGEGSSESYVEDYLAMAEQAGFSKKEQLSLNLAEQGPYEAVSLLYGPSEEMELVSDIVDLTDYAEQNPVDRFNRQILLGCSLEEAPLAGKIWYPKGQTDCPVLFIVHGNHVYEDDSYLGYDYLGAYLASFGYVTVSVDENVCNELSGENDARAVLLLENIKYLLAQNETEGGALYQLLDEERIALAGHSRGGEAISEAYLFNEYDSYPDCGNIRFDYHFQIRSLIAIAPTVDQYVPAEHEVALRDVNYMIIHGANDQDVSRAMGQKQYGNVVFTGRGDYLKTMIYLSGANHGQFNSVWGKYDSVFPLSLFLNVANFMPEKEQHRALQTFVKTFLDVTLLEDKEAERLLEECYRYQDELPNTLYQQTYQTSDFLCFADFEEDSDLNSMSLPGGRISTKGSDCWTEEQIVMGTRDVGENYAMYFSWEDSKEAQVTLHLPAQDITGRAVVFDLADAGEEQGEALLDGTVILEDAQGNQAEVRISDHTPVWPSLPVRLGKVDILFGTCEYKTPFQTVTIPDSAFLEENGALDGERIVKMTIAFEDDDTGSVWLDNIGLE